jgi:hypothetical protein
MGEGTGRILMIEEDDEALVKECDGPFDGDADAPDQGGPVPGEFPVVTFAPPDRPEAHWLTPPGMPAVMVLVYAEGGIIQTLLAVCKRKENGFWEWKMVHSGERGDVAEAIDAKKAVEQIIDEAAGYSYTITEAPEGLVM